VTDRPLVRFNRISEFLLLSPTPAAAADGNMHMACYCSTLWWAGESFMLSVESKVNLVLGGMGRDILQGTCLVDDIGRDCVEMKTYFLPEGEFWNFDVFLYWVLNGLGEYPYWNGMFIVAVLKISLLMFLELPAAWLLVLKPLP
jgi:hypothetical protein